MCKNCLVAVDNKARQRVMITVPSLLGPQPKLSMFSRHFGTRKHTPSAATMRKPHQRSYPVCALCQPLTHSPLSSTNADALNFCRAWHKALLVTVRKKSPAPLDCSKNASSAGWSDTPPRSRKKNIIMTGKVKIRSRTKSLTLRRWRSRNSSVCTTLLS